MQGKKKFTPKLFVNFRLDEAVPDDNFYKILLILADRELIL